MGPSRSKQALTWFAVGLGGLHSLSHVTRPKLERRSAAGHLPRFGVAALLLTAFLFKGYQLLRAAAGGNSTGEATLLERLMVPIEFGLALWLILGFWPWLSRISAVALFGAFAGYSLRGGLQGRVSCGCFGQVTVNPWIMLAVDLGAILLLFWWRPNGRASLVGAVDAASQRPTRQFFLLRSPRLLGLASCVALGLSTGWLAAAHRDPGSRWREPGSLGELVVLEPTTWLSKKLPILSNINIGGELTEGDWIVLLYHHDCPKCQEAVLHYENQASRISHPLNRRIALVEIPPWDPSESSSESGCHYGRLENGREWFVETPTHLFLSAGVVLEVSQEPLDVVPISETSVRNRPSRWLPHSPEYASDR